MQIKYLFLCIINFNTARYFNAIALFRILIFYVRLVAKESYASFNSSKGKSVHE